MCSFGNDGALCCTFEIVESVWSDDNFASCSRHITMSGRQDEIIMDDTGSTSIPVGEEWVLALAGVIASDKLCFVLRA